MILEVDNIHVSYGEIGVLHGLSLGIEAGELACIIGPNGSGKSTLFRSIMGFVSPQSGRILFEGADITGIKPHEVIVRGIGCVMQGRTAFTEMTVLENLELGGYSLIRRDKALYRQNLQRVLEIFPLLTGKLRTRAGILSGGQQQMVEMGRALMLNPRLLLLDEPTLGLAPNVSADVFRAIKDLVSQELTVLMIEQNAQRSLEISDRAFVLDLGCVRMVDEGPAILRNPEVRRLYLGAA